MASITQRGPYQFEVQIRRRGHKAVSKTFTYRKDAEAWARKTESEIERGLFIHNSEAERMTLHDALERYGNEITPAKKGAAQEEYRLKLWKAAKVSKSAMAHVQAKDIAKWRDERIKNGASNATVRNDLALLSHVFTIAAKEWGLPISNPVAMLRKPKVSNSRDRLLNNEEEKHLLDALDNPEDIIGNRNLYMPVLVRVAIESAMRQGELLGLQWENIRFDGSKGIALLPDTKNGTSRRVPLSTKAASALKTLPGKRTGKVFSTTASAVKQSWVRAIKRAQRNYLKACVANGTAPEQGFLENLTFHDLRHLATTRLAAIYPSEDVAKITGHKDNRMLMRYYHPRAEDLLELLD